MTSLSYKLDVQKLADTDIRFNAVMSTALNDQKDSRTKTQIEFIINDFGSMIDSVRNSSDQLKGQYSKVSGCLNNMMSVPADLVYSPFAEEKAKSLLGMNSEIKRRLKDTIGNKDQNLTTSLQILGAVDSSIIQPNFVGLSNYSKLLKNGRIWDALLNTVEFTLFAVGIEVIVGMICALIMNMDFSGRGVVRASVLIPWSIPAAVSALIWRFMYDGQFGIISKMLTDVGIISNPSLILTTKWGAMFGLILEDVWKTSPFVALLILAGLQTIDFELYQAAKVDGATVVQRFFVITLPLVKPAILVALLFRTLDAFRVFDLISVMTNGGPANSTESLSVFVYKTMFSTMDFGTGSAIAVVMFFFVAVLCFIFIKGLGTNLFRRDNG